MNADVANRLQGVILAAADYAGMVAHAELTFPVECCGVIFGRVEGEVARIVEVRPARNITTDDPATSFQIDWCDLLQAVKYARSGSLDILGFYHSHPTGPRELSTRDLNESWEYVLCMVVPGTDAAAFRPDPRGPSCGLVLPGGRARPIDLILEDA